MCKYVTAKKLQPTYKNGGESISSEDAAFYQVQNNIIYIDQPFLGCQTRALLVQEETEAVFCSW